MPAYDYQCEDCAEIFEKQHPMSGPLYPIQCPVCSSGNVHKVIICPAITVAWRDPRSSSDVSGLIPKYHPPARGRPHETAEDFGGV